MSSKSTSDGHVVVEGNFEITSPNFIFPPNTTISIEPNQDIYIGNDKGSISIDKEGNVTIKCDSFIVEKKEDKEPVVVENKKGEESVFVQADKYKDPKGKVKVVANAQGKPVKTITTPAEAVSGISGPDIPLTPTASGTVVGGKQAPFRRATPSSGVLGPFTTYAEKLSMLADERRMKKDFPIEADWSTVKSEDTIEDLHNLAHKYLEKVAKEHRKDPNVIKSEKGSIAHQEKGKKSDPLGAGSPSSPKYVHRRTVSDVKEQNNRQKLEEKILHEIVMDYAKDVGKDDDPFYIGKMKKVFKEKSSSAFYKAHNDITEAEAGFNYYIKQLDKKHEELYPKVDLPEPKVVEVVRPYNWDDFKDFKDKVRKHFKDTASNAIYKSFNTLLGVMTNLKEKVDAL